MISIAMIDLDDINKGWHHGWSTSPWHPWKQRAYTSGRFSFSIFYTCWSNIDHNICIMKWNWRWRMFSQLKCSISFSLRALGKPWRLCHSHLMAICWRWIFSSLHSFHHIHCPHTHQSLHHPPCQLLFIVFTATTIFSSYRFCTHHLSPSVVMLSLNKMSRWLVMTGLCTCSSSRRQVFCKTKIQKIQNRKVWQNNKRMWGEWSTFRKSRPQGGGASKRPQCSNKVCQEEDI